MELLFFETIDSTNKYAKEHIRELKDFTVVYAGMQTNGRGRFERKWEHVGSENLYASIVLKPSKTLIPVYANLTQYLCLIIAEVFEDYGLKVEIKWPNDIKIDGEKICGILAECVAKNNELEGLVLGFGVNLNVESQIINTINQPATALNLKIGRHVDREIFLKKVLDRFCLRYNRFIEEGFISIKEDYKKRAKLLNLPVTVKVFDKDVSGTAIDITDDGALKIVDSNNKEHVLLIGDIL